MSGFTRLEGFPARLHRIRKAHKLTALQLAERANVSHSSIQNWEHGRNEPTLHALVSLAKALDTTVDNLLGNCE